MDITWRERLASAAGFFNGEGWTGTGIKNGRRYPRLAISQADRYVLDVFRDTVTVGHVHGPYASVGRKNPLYQYETNGCHRVRAVVAMLWPWLSPIKRAQAVQAFAVVDQSERDAPPRRVDRITCKFGHPRTHYSGSPHRKRCRTCEAKWNSAGRERRLARLLADNADLDIAWA